MKIESVWDFVMENYPNYSSSNEIAWEGDVYKLVNKEYEEGDCAHDLLMSEYDGDINNLQIRVDWMEQYIDILERSIENWQNQQK